MTHKSSIPHSGHKVTPIYFDHNATTPICDEVRELLPSLLNAWGNPSSIHWAGRQPKNILREARISVAQSIAASPLEVVFTSGGSEANNTVLKGVFDFYRSSRSHRQEYICSMVEHPSVMKTMKYLETQGAVVHYISVNAQGELDLEQYNLALSEKTALVSIMLANNETGTLFPIQKLAQLAKAKGALFHTDAVQGFGKISLNMQDLGVDFASFSGHKFYSIKGSGFLYMRKGHSITQLIHGGGQERHRRGGTENTIGIGSLGQVAKMAHQIPMKAIQLGNLRDHFEKRILCEIPDVKITARETLRLPNTSSLILSGCDGETLLMSLDMKGYAVSTGAACSSGNPEPSPVLLAMGLTRQEAQNSLRVSFGWENNLAQVDQFVDDLKIIVERLRNIKEIYEESRHV